MTLTKCIGGAPTLPDYTCQSYGCQRQARQLLWKTRGNRSTSDFVRRAPVPQAAVDVTPVTAWEHSETLLFRPERRDFTISRQVESHRPVEVKAVRNVVSGDRHKLPKPIRKTRLPEVRKCMCFDKCFNVHVSGTAFRTVRQRAAHFMPYCPNAMTFKTSVTSTQS